MQYDLMGTFSKENDSYLRDPVTNKYKKWERNNKTSAWPVTHKIKRSGRDTMYTYVTVSGITCSPMPADPREGKKLTLRRRVSFPEKGEKRSEKREAREARWKDKKKGCVGEKWLKVGGTTVGGFKNEKRSTEKFIIFLNSVLSGSENSRKHAIFMIKQTINRVLDESAIKNRLSCRVDGRYYENHLI